MRIGLYAVTNWRDRAEQTAEAEAARDLFLAIYASVRRLWLTALHGFDETKKNLVPLCFAFMPALFGTELNAALAKTIPPIANHPRMLADACWFLWKNGVEPTRLTRLVRDAGGDLEESLRDLKQWSYLVTSKQREIEFTPDLQQLAEALGIAFSDGNRSRPGSRMRQ